MTEKQAQDEWRLSVLERAAPGPGMPAHLQNLVRLRRAEVLSGLSFQHARRGEAAQAAARGEAAVRELALVSRPDLGDGDETLYEEVAVRVAAARWAVEPQGMGRGQGMSRSWGVTLKMEPGQPGETCVSFLGQKGKEGQKGQQGSDGKEAQVLQRRCTYGLPWGASLVVAPRGGVAALAVQQLPGWVELWVLRPPAAGSGSGSGEAGWRLDVLPPAPADPDLGYAEVAGFSPDGGRMLVVREARVGGAVRRSFQVLRADTLEVERQARNPELLAAYRSWASPSWKQRTLALR